jgi:hypothetical protein
MARREADAEAGLIGPADFDFEILQDARASSNWRKRLVDIGVEPMFLGGPHQLRRALKNYKIGDVYQDRLRHHALMKAGKDAALYFSLHFDDESNPKGVVRGHLASGTVVTYSTSSHTASANSACTSCRSEGLEACVIPWDKAVRKGHLEAFADDDEIQVSIESWLAAIKREVKRSGRDHVSFRRQLYKVSARLEDEPLFMT